MMLNELSLDEKNKIKIIINLAKSDKLQQAKELIGTLSTNAVFELPEWIMFKIENLREMSGTGGSAAMLPGTGMGMATKRAFKKKRPAKPKYFTKVKNKPFKYKLASMLNEMSYSKFKNESSTKNKQQTLHTAVREIKKRLSEVNRILEYTTKMRAELSEDKALKYSRFTERALGQITTMVAELYSSVKKLKN